MKLAVAAQSPDLNRELAPSFGRANYFVVMNTDSDDFTVLGCEVGSLVLHRSDSVPIPTADVRVTSAPASLRNGCLKRKGLRTLRMESSLVPGVG
jgi:hypothetical protein